MSTTLVFGGVSAFGPPPGGGGGQRAAGPRVLEVGVGTGLALPHYDAEQAHHRHRPLGRDARPARASGCATSGCCTSRRCSRWTPRQTGFDDGAFDIAVAMFVASVVPNPRLLLAEMRRVVRPGGHLLFVNHFAAERGPRWWVERALAPASRKLGWHPDFARDALLPAEDMARRSSPPVPPFGLFTLVCLPELADLRAVDLGDSTSDTDLLRRAQSVGASAAMLGADEADRTRIMQACDSGSSPHCGVRRAVLAWRRPGRKRRTIGSSASSRRTARCSRASRACTRW